MKFMNVIILNVFFQFLFAFMINVLISYKQNFNTYTI